MTTAHRIKPSVPDLNEESLRAEVAAIDAELAQMKAGRPRVVLEETVEALRRHDEATATASRRAEQARARLAAAQGRLAEFAAAEEEERRQARYEVALARVGAAEEYIRGAYPVLIREFHDLLRTVAEAEIARVAANAALPTGAAAIPAVESFRSERDVPAQVLARERVKQWARSNGQRLADSSQVDVTSHGVARRLGHVRDAIPEGEVRGVISHSSGNRSEVVMREFERVELTTAVKGRSAVSLFEAVLPGLLAGDRAGWAPVKGGPAAVLTALERLESEPHLPQLEPKLCVEYLKVQS